MSPNTKSQHSRLSSTNENSTGTTRFLTIGILSLLKQSLGLCAEVPDFPYDLNKSAFLLPSLPLEWLYMDSIL